MKKELEMYFREVTFSPSGMGYIHHIHVWERTIFNGEPDENCTRYICRICATVKDFTND